MQLRQLLADQIRVLGTDHPATFNTRGILAYRLGEAGRVKEAVTQLRQLLADATRVLGPDHPTTLATRRFLDPITPSTTVVRGSTSV
jgi:hypothetical protein